MAQVYKVAEVEIAPEKPPRGPIVWARENLFSTPFNSLLTIVALVAVILFLQGMLGFIFAEERRWEAGTTNWRLLMVQAYPLEQFIRVWISVGVVVALATMSLAVWDVGGKTSIAKTSKVVMGLGTALLVLEVLGPFSVTARLYGIVIGSVVIGAAWLARSAAGERAKAQTISVMSVLAVSAILGSAALFLIQVPVPDPGGETGDTILRGLAASTTVPIAALVGLGIAAYLLGRAFRAVASERVARAILVGLWLASFPAIVLVILRDPAIAYSRVWDTYLPMGAGFVVLGGFVVWYLAGPKTGEGGRGIAALLLLAAISSWFVPMLMVVRGLLFFLALFALAAPTFGGTGRTRTRYALAWAGFAVAITYLGVLGEAGTTVEVPGRSFLGGLLLTFVLAIAGISLSFPIGVLLALGRTSTMPIFRLLSVGYIEVVRGVPLITWLIVGAVILPLFLPAGVDVDSAVRAIIFIALFSGAYLAENVRGGLQSIPRGQYEAARAVGMTTVQTTAFIVLPQALRAVIPALVGQVIALFKDTSLVAIVALFDLLKIARDVIPNQSQPFNFLGSQQEMLLLAAAIYWVFTFSVSRASLRLEKKLGVGER